MPNSKISALTSATTPLTGSEVLPIVQSGATVKVPNNDLRPKQIQSNATSGVLQVAGPTAGTTRVMTTPDANFTAARTDAAQSFTGDQTLSTGNLIQGTAAKGINFTANTPAAGMTSQLLNWYEEGTWTPVLEAESGAFGAITYNALNGGRYVRVGKVVHIQALLYTDSVAAGTASLEVRVGGLPFTSVASSSGKQDGFSSIAVSQTSNWVTNQPSAALVRANSKQIGLYYRTTANGASNVMTVSEVTTGSTGNLLRIGGTYTCA